MATLKYRKSRKNKKQLRKKKRTYKKRKTTRRKKGGAVEVPYDKEPYDKNLEDLTTKFTVSTNIIEQLKLLEQKVADDKKSCSINYKKMWFNNSDTFFECQTKKVNDYCTILEKVDEILEKDKSLNEISSSEFNDYKVKLEEKIKKHAERAGIDALYIDFACGMAKQKLEQP